MSLHVLLVSSVVAFLSHIPGVASAAPLAACTVPGVARAAECGTIAVPENRAQPKARAINLYVVVLKGAEPRDAEPVIFFAGGPGQGAATLAASLLRDLEPVAPTRDIILIDQRGTGRSGALTCDGGFDVLAASRAADLRACRDRLTKQADLNHYGTDESADDAADVLGELGYSRVNVIAASYGTRLALRFMERHRALVRTAILRAPAPDGFNILSDGSRHAHAALTRVFSDCRVDPGCNAAFPDLGNDLVKLRTRLTQQPNPVSLETFQLTLYALLLSTSTRQVVPWLVHTSASKDSPALATLAETVGGLYRTVAVGAYLSVVCREDAPFVSSASGHSTDEFDAGTAMIAAACTSWPVRPAVRRPRARHAIPTLVVTGEFDPAMPPEVGHATVNALERGTHIVLPATAHGPLLPGCASRLAHRFVQSAGREVMAADCLKELTPPPFRTQ